MSANESRLAEAAPENLRGGGSAPILATASHSVAVLDGVVLTPSELALYQSGVEAGIELGRRQVEQENRESHETAARVARMVAETVPFEELCRRRGEERRAEHQRRILQARGVLG
ncbi:hypothetical protein [Cellulosimicrobium sp. 72-3]|uniref:hypothetical protein n=1 Tax=Cellulosimicrobium sp. 72-3 TaxID=2731680 RepID=UPI00148EEAA7|nr:hypothetical protein [Cellulosimicrobium sp. 72-3]